MFESTVCIAYVIYRAQPNVCIILFVQTHLYRTPIHAAIYEYNRTLTFSEQKPKNKNDDDH